MCFVADTIDKWDEDKLKEVVEEKHGGKTKQKTDIVSHSQPPPTSSILHIRRPVTNT